MDGITDFMRAAANRDITVLMKLICGQSQESIVEELLKRDSKERSALDWARSSKNYLAATIISKLTQTLILNLRIVRRSTSENLPHWISIENKNLSNCLIRSIRNKNIQEASSLLQTNSLVREDVEQLGEVYFVDIPWANGYTPLMLASALDMADIVYLLINANCPVNTANRLGHTALTLAVCSGHSDVVAYLLAKGADLYKKTEEGRNALHYACFYKKAKIVRIILSFIIEKFGSFRVESHSLVEFDYSRWVDYADKIELLIHEKDNCKLTPLELLEFNSINNEKEIERSLKVFAGRRRLPREGEATQLESIAATFGGKQSKTDGSADAASHSLDESNETNSSGDDQISDLSFDALQDDNIQEEFYDVRGEKDVASLQHSQSTDNMHASNLNHVYSVSSGLPLANETKHIKTYFSDVQKKLNDWRSYAVKEALLVQEVPCILQCAMKIKREDMMTHVRDYCALRTIQCGKCHAILVHDKIQSHERRMCNQRVVACINALQGCGYLLTPNQMDLHLKLHCNYRLAACRQFCGIFVPHILLQDHESLYCRNRSINCDLCKCTISANEYSVHIAQHCVMRRVICTVGCGLEMCAKDRLEHEENICTAACNNKACCLKIGPHSRLKHHEINECQFRNIKCRNNCGSLTFRKYSQFHEGYDCLQRPLLCTNGCGISLCYGNLEDHMKNHCHERLVRCPSDYVGHKVYATVGVDQRREGIVFQYRRRQSGSTSRPTSIHELLVRFSDSHDWLNVFDVEIIPERPSKLKDKNIFDGVYRCSWISYSHLNHHLSYECQQRKVLINAREDHNNELAVAEIVPFASVLPALHNLTRVSEELMEMHNNSNKIHCTLCGLLVDVTCLQEHVLKYCNEVDTLCSSGCGSSVKRKLMDLHMSEECRKRFVLCPQCNCTEYWSEELDIHMQQFCSSRAISCKLLCGITNLLAYEEENHHVNHCPQRLIQCECGFWVRSVEYDDHQFFLCDFRKVKCAQGCEELVRFCDRERHIKFLCKQKHIFDYSKRVDCPNGCGASMLKRELLRHLTYECDKRQIECPQLCGNKVQLDRLNEHLIACPQRLICCEPGMKSCEKPLHLWFYKGTTHCLGTESLSAYDDHLPLKTLDNSSIGQKSTNSLGSSVFYDGSAMKFRENIRLLTCEKHQMNAFMAAIKLHDKVLLEYLIKQVEESGDIDQENIYGDTVLTLACRQGMLEFVEILVQHGADINKETFNGRTALIEAIKCREENLPLLEYLVKQGCIVSYRTQKHRRTALDWALRFNSSDVAAYEERRLDCINNIPVNNKQVKEMNNFASMSLETEKALEFTNLVDTYNNIVPMELTDEQRRLLGRPKTVRILELAMVVQQQCNIMFQMIAIGNTDYVKSIIQDGDFFDPQNEEKAYEQMNKHIVLAQSFDEEIVSIQKQMFGISDKVDFLYTGYKTCLDNLKGAEDAVDKLFQTEQDIDRAINSFFVKFEKLAARLNVVDLEEVTRLLNPANSIIIAMFSYGVMFGLVPPELLITLVSPDVYLDKIIYTKASWESLVRRHLSSAHDALRLLQTFSRAKVQVRKSKYLFEISDLILEVFKINEMNESLWVTGSQLPEEIRQTSPHSVVDPPEITTLRSSSPPKLSDLIVGSNLSEQSDASHFEPNRKSFNSLAGNLKRSYIDDYEWDSDAEEEKAVGSWIHGEWAPRSRRRVDWWNPISPTSSLNSKKSELRVKSRSERLVLLCDEIVQSESAKTLQEMKVSDENREPYLSRVLVEEDKILNIIRPLDDQLKIQKENRDREELILIDNPASKKETKWQLAQQNSGVNEQILQDTQSATDSNGVDMDYAGQAFVACIISLLTAISHYGHHHISLEDKKRATREAAAVVDCLKVNLNEALVAYEEQFQKRSRLEQTYIKLLKKSKFHREKVDLYTNKVRVCRLLNYVCVNGHTAVSYAASYGNYDLVEEMLSRGASVGYTASVVVEVVRFIQLSYRIYRLAGKAKVQSEQKQHNLNQISPSQEVSVTGGEGEALSHIDPLEAFTSSRAYYLQIIREMEIVKERRKRVLSLIIFNRQKIRLPIPEALYMGHFEIIQRIHERKLWHSYFAYTFNFPLPRIPYLRQKEFAYSHEKRSIHDIMAHAIGHVSSGIYTSEQGWLPPGHAKEPFGEMFTEISKIVDKMSEKNTRFLAAKKRLRLIKNSKIAMREYEQKLVQLIYQRRFTNAMNLVVDRGINVNLETPDGQTLLIAAAEENVHALNHQYVLNSEFKPVLAVEFLLDRYSFRPNINHETKSGLTALLRACMLGREDVVVALLNRGANINHKNRHGMSVLHYTTYCGHDHIVHLLIERNIDVHITDSRGKTAYHVAEEQNFIAIMTLLSQRATGNFGQLTFTRGNVENHVSCPLGCGERLFAYMVEMHTLFDCECKYVSCPMGCTESRIMKKEMQNHVGNHCIYRSVSCSSCAESLVFCQVSSHLEKECTQRLVCCVNKDCDKSMPFKDLEKHLRVCAHKLVPCPLICDTYLPEIQIKNHVTNMCINRRVSCPLKCRNLLIYKYVEDHTTKVCPKRLVECSLCRKMFEKQQLERHMRDECLLRDFSCPNGCSVLVSVNNLSWHLDNECHLRYISCPLNCDMVVQVKHINYHTEQQCENRLEECQFRCVADEKLPLDSWIVRKFPQKLLALHERYDCVNREVKCYTCGEHVLARNKMHHEIMECKHRSIPCPNQGLGCPMHIALDKLAHHLAVQCGHRDVLCPLGCQLYLRSSAKIAHVQEQCLLRYITCPLGCKELIKVKDVMSHISIDCARRYVTHVCYNSHKEVPTAENKNSTKEENNKKDINSLLKNISVADIRQEPPQVSKKVLIRKEETLRVQKIRSELKLSAELRSRLIQAVQCSSGANLIE